MKIHEITGYHGSPNRHLKSVRAQPKPRQYDNATSVFGAFFSPDRQGATRYAGQSGRIYQTDIPVRNPYQMPLRDFLRFQKIERGPNGENLTPDQWPARLEQLKREATALRDKLVQDGHDGIVVHHNGRVVEIASFGDVQFDQPDLFD